MRRVGATLLTGLMLAVTLAGCGGSATTSTAHASQTATTTGSSNSGGATASSTNTGKLVFGVPVEPHSLDPHICTDATCAWEYYNIYDTLVDLTPNLKIVPALATSWKQVNTTTWQFTLRKGVQFSDGTPFNADAVVFNIERALNPKNPGRAVSSIGPIVGAKAVNANTVDIITKGPDPSLLYGLSIKVVLGMVSPTAVKKWGKDYGHHPVGTGPFELKSWQTNVQVVLTKNPHYWGTTPTLDTLVFKVIPDAGARLLAFENKSIDVLLEPTPSQMLSLAKLPQIQIDKKPGIGISYLAFNLRYPPFNDVRVRQALEHAIDIPAIIKDVLHGLAVPATSYVNSNVFGYKNENLQQVYNYDPAEAEKLLEQAGWKLQNGVMTKNGKPFTFPFAVGPGRVPGDKDTVIASQQQLAKIGLQAKVQEMEWAQFLTFLKTQPKKYGMFFLTWFAISADGDFGLTPFDSAQMPPVGINRMYYDSAQFDKLFYAGNSELNQAKRLQDYGQAQDLLVKDAPWIPLFQEYQITALQPYVHGYQMTPLEYYVTNVAGVTVGAH